MAQWVKFESCTFGKLWQCVLVAHAPPYASGGALCPARGTSHSGTLGRPDGVTLEGLHFGSPSWRCFAVL